MGQTMKTLQLLETCKETSSLNEKKQLIKDFFNSNPGELQLKLLQIYLDPCYATNFDKKSASKPGIQEPWMLTFIENEELDEIIDMFHVRDVTGNEACGFYRLCTETLYREDIKLLNIILFKEPMGITYKVVNDVYKELYGKDFIEVYQVQLANAYDPEKKYKGMSQPLFYASRKLDGLRCYYKSGSGQLMSRNNKPITGFEHLASSLQQICDVHELDLIDGELYKHGLNFQKTAGIINSDKNINEDEKNQINYNIFAILGKNIKNTSVMVDILTNRIKTNVYDSHITIVQYEIVPNNKQSIEEKCIQYVNEGYEGIMLRHPDKQYDFKRSDALLKYKMFKEMCLTIVGFEEGTGKNIGVLGALILTNKSGTINCKCGSGFDEEERNTIWSDQSNWIGKIVEIKYQDITDDGSSLRFPIYRGRRGDVESD